MQLTLIRHLPTKWNEQGLLQGKRDIPIMSLSDAYRKEMMENKQYLKKVGPFDIVLASTLIRTQQTAKLYGYEPEINPLLDELDFGSYEGLPKKRLITDFHKEWLEKPEELILGESMKELKNRIILFLEHYKPYHHVLLFGHGSWIRALFSYVNDGHLNNMNDITYKNNECMTISN